MKEKVFIVDDNKHICKSIKRLLKLEGYSVGIYSTSEEFLKKNTPEVSGCLLLDILMPGGMSGLELQEKLNTYGYKIPVIFVTVIDKSYYIEKAMSKGAAGYLIKPFKTHSLLKLLKAVLEGKNTPKKIIR